MVSPPGARQIPRGFPIVEADSWYHAVNRGSDGACLFPSPSAAERFVRRLGNAVTAHRIELHAYCVMGTHYHLLVRARESDLREAIAALERPLPGVRDRARVRRLAMGRHLLRVTRYIHRNPVEAGLVRRAAEWPWSSFGAYIDPARTPAWLRTDAVLGWLGSIGVRSRYREYVDAPGSR